MLNYLIYFIINHGGTILAYWSVWTAWNSCNSLCGGGFRKRSRNCTAMSLTGGNCNGNYTEFNPCNKYPCNNSE